MSFGAKGVYQGLKNGVTFEIKINYVPFVTSVHYMLCLGMFSQKWGLGDIIKQKIEKHLDE